MEVSSAPFSFYFSVSSKERLASWASRQLPVTAAAFYEPKLFNFSTKFLVNKLST